jgi:hypothetical protein
VRVICKVLIFTVALVVSTYLSVYVLGLPLESPLTWWYVAGTLVLGNVSFLLYDRLLAMLTDLYVCRLRPKIFSHHR